MSLYAQYIKERMGDDIIEIDEGFVTFRYLNEGRSVYIIDIYVKPEFRKTKSASFLANTVASIAEAKGCSEMLGSVCPQAKNPTDSIKVLLAYGMELQSSSKDLLIFRKDIGTNRRKEGSRQQPNPVGSV